MRHALGRVATIGAPDQRPSGPLAATVADNRDPLKRGRLKLVIPELSGPDAAHPEWTWPALGFGKSNSNVWGSTVGIPEIGDTAWVLLLHSEPGAATDDMIWLPGWAIDGAMPALLLTHYPKRRGLVTPSGHSLYFDDDTGDDSDSGEVKLRHRDGAALTLEKGGDAALDSKTGGVTKINGDDHPLPRWDTFEGELSDLLADLATQLALGTSGSPLAQQLVGLAAIQTLILAFRAKLVGTDDFDSTKGRNG